MGPRSTKRTRGNALILLTIFCSSIIVPAVGSTDGYWVAKAPAPEPIGGQPGHVAELNGKIYAVTSGQNLWKYDPTTNNWTAQTRSEYDPINKTWEEKPSLPKAVDVYEVAACAGKLYVFGARNSGTTSYNVIEIYNPVTSIWQVEIESLPINLYVQPIVVNDKIYIIGGTHQAGFAVIVYDKTNQVYDTKTGTWTTMAALPMGVANYASAVLDNKIYLFGGTNNSWPGRQYVVSQYTNVVQIYDVVNDSWTFGAPVSTEMCSMAAAAIPGTSGTTQIYLAGGRYTEYLGNEGAVLGFPPVNTTQIYDPATNTWTTGPQMLTARSGLSLINVNNRLYALGGTNDDGNSHSAINDLATNEQFTAAGYGLTTPSPILTGSPSASLTQTELPMVTPSLTPTSTHGNNYDLKSQFGLWVVLAVVAVVGVAVLVGVWIKRRR